MPSDDQMKITFVGNPAQNHVARHLHVAAKNLGMESSVMNATEAFSKSVWVNRIFWRLFGHRPPKLHSFSARVTRQIIESGSVCVITTGISPVSANALGRIRLAGIKTINFSTDDPWSASSRSHWFFAAMKEYDCVYTPRTANIAQIRRINPRVVEHLPFAYAPDIHFPSAEAECPSDYDVLFYGNVDRDRESQLLALAKSNLRLTLYAANRLSEGLRSSLCGYADPLTMRSMVARCPVTLVIGRKTNRDGHAMRSYEVPAMRGCILAEDTLDHRALYGNGAAYFSSLDSLIEGAQKLIVATPERREALRAQVFAQISGSPNSYADRLKQLIAGVDG